MAGEVYKYDSEFIEINKEIDAPTVAAKLSKRSADGWEYVESFPVPDFDLRVFLFRREDQETQAQVYRGRGST